MNVKESDYRTSRKYRSANCRQINIELNKKLDEDILVWLDSQENKNGYLKKLIREDMNRQGFVLPEKENGFYMPDRTKQELIAIRSRVNMIQEKLNSFIREEEFSIMNTPNNLHSSDNYFTAENALDDLEFASSLVADVLDAFDDLLEGGKHE